MEPEGRGMTASASVNQIGEVTGGKSSTLNAARFGTPGREQTLSFRNDPSRQSLRTLGGGLAGLRANPSVPNLARQSQTASQFLEEKDPTLTRYEVAMGQLRRLIEQEKKNSFHVKTIYAQEME